MELKLRLLHLSSVPGILLIVLNGIETEGFVVFNGEIPELLIVLNGIETKDDWSSVADRLAFNRTKWN